MSSINRKFPEKGFVNLSICKQMFSYPSTSVDVKCENPIYISSKDQNPRSFHYTRDTKDIGGNLVISVLSQLRNSSEVASTANVTLSEKLGSDFLFMQVQAPSALNCVGEFNATKLIFSDSEHPVAYAFGLPLTELRINPVTYWNFGSNSIVGVGGSYADIQKYDPYGYRLVYRSSGNFLSMSRLGDDSINVYSSNVAFNLTGMVAVSRGIRQGIKGVNLFSSSVPMTRCREKDWPPEETMEPGNDWLLTRDGSGREISMTHTPYADVVSSSGMFSPPVPESIVSFNFKGDSTMVGMPQTKLIAKLFSDGIFDDIPKGECAQYVLKDLRAGATLCYIKIHREGYMTSAQVSSVIRADLACLEMEFRI